MPATVEFPIHVRTDAKVLLDRQEDLLETAELALGRALRKARRTVPGGARDSALPDVSSSVLWLGADAGAVYDPARRAIEQKLAELIDRLVREAGRDDLLPAPGDRSDPAEPTDGARLDPLLGVYTLPSYKGGQDTTLPVTGKRTPDPDPGDPALEWLPIGSWEELEREIIFALGLRDIEVVPQWGDLGAIYRFAGGTVNVWVKRLQDDRVLIDNVPLLGLRSPGLDGARRAIVNRPVELSPNASYSLRYLAPATPSGRTEFARQYYEPRFTRLLREHARGGSTMSSADVDAQVAQRVRDAIEAIVATFPAAAVCFLELRVGGDTLLLYTDVDIPSDLNVELMPIVHLGEPRPRPRPQRTARATGAGGTLGDRTAGAGGDGGGAGAGTGTTGARDGQGARGARGGGGADGSSGSDEGAASARRGGFVDIEPPPDMPPPEDGSAFPTLSGTDAATDVCEPFLGEPSVATLGSEGESLNQAMGRIAARLEIQPCEFVGHFLISAASAVGRRARAVGLSETTDAGESSTSAVPAPDTLASVEFHPHASVQIQLLRHLAGVVPLISQLSAALRETIASNGRRIAGEKHDEPTSWTLAFIEELHPIIDESVAELFKMTCRVLLLQMLLASLAEIKARAKEPGFTRFASLFEQVVLPQLADVEELLRMRTMLQDAPGQADVYRADEYMVRATLANVPQTPESSSGSGSGQASSASLGVSAQPASWLEATANLTGALTPHGHLTGGSPAANAYQTLEEGGVWRIRDRNGQLWTLEAIERAILLRRGTVESVEPLVKQLTDLPDVMERFRDTQVGVRTELASILAEMQADNEQITQRAREDPDFGFKAGRIVESDVQATVPGALYALTGIHLHAHREIGEFFGGDPFYGRGIDFLFGSELGLTGLIHFGEFVGLVLLSIVCPPAGMYAGVALALNQLGEAQGRERIYGALIAPEEVLTYAEVEAGLFAAELGLALSLLPVAGKFLGEARAAFAVAGEEALDVSEAAAQAAAEEAASAMLRTAEEGFIEQFVLELGKAYAIQMLFEAVLSPIMEGLEREWGTTGPIGGLERGLSEVADRARERGSQASGARRTQ
jgi:hypothetical protein